MTLELARMMCCDDRYLFVFELLWNMYIPIIQFISRFGKNFTFKGDDYKIDRVVKVAKKSGVHIKYD